MTQTRFADIAAADLTEEQRKVVAELTAGPRGGVRGPFHALLRSPDLADRVRQLGDYIRFGNSLPPALREMVILLVARFWTAQYGLSPAIPDAIAIGKRPEGMSADETLIYDFVSEILDNKDVSDPTYAAAIERFGERTVLDILSTAGYFGFVSLILNAKRHPLPEGSQILQPIK
jgi:4-carboxymuconolactone decarboxylase